MFYTNKRITFCVECIIFITVEDLIEQYLEIFRKEKRRSIIMTKARTQPFGRAINNNIVYYDGIRGFLRSVTDRKNALFLHNNHFCLIWKSEGISFNQTIRELKDNFKIVNNYITEENVGRRFKYEIIPNKNESYLTKFILYELKTHNTDRARPYNMIFYRSSKLAGKYNRGLTPYEIENVKKDTFVFDGSNCISNALNFLLKFKGEPRKTITNKTVENNLQLHAHNGRGFGTWINLNNLPCDEHIVDIIKNGKGIISMRTFNGYIDKNKKISSISIFWMWYDLFKLFVREIRKNF